MTVVGNHRGTEIRVDLQAIQANIKMIKQHVQTDCDLFAVVKADAYGHGAVPVAHAARLAGADGFCVAVIDEGLELRQSGIVEPILVLGLNTPFDAVTMASNNLSATVGSLAFLQEAQILLASSHQKLKVHFGLDTGMGRIGFLNETDLKAALAFVADHPAQFEFEGIFTHFATADTADDTYFQQQLAKFNEFKAIIDASSLKPKYVHMANSATSLWHPVEGNLMRYGVALYGLNPAGSDLDLPLPLKPALSLSTTIVACKEVPAGTKIGYGSTYTAAQTEWIATLPIGYADGWLRRMQGFKVLVDGQYCELVGRICMDQCMIKVPHEFPIGTKVTLLGKNGDQEITVQEAAEYAGTINYEILCSLSDRIARKYY